MKILVESPRFHELSRLFSVVRSNGWELLLPNHQSMVYDMVICDWRLGGTRQSEVNSKNNEQYCPILAILPQHLEQDDLLFWGSAADDFLFFPWRPEELLLKIHTLMKYKKWFETTQFMMTHDSLTGLPNAVGLCKLFEKERERFERYQTPCVVALADIDHFKQVNDQHGHQVGDSVLQTVASTLSQFVRKLDIVGRYGGEEFTFIFPHTNLAGGKVACERLIRLIGNNEMLPGICVTMSMGISQISSSSSTWEALIRCSDRAMYRAKAGGRNRVWVQERSVISLGHKH